MPPSPATRVTPATRCRNDRRAYAGPATGGDALAVLVKNIRASTPTTPAISDGMPSTSEPRVMAAAMPATPSSEMPIIATRRRRQAIRPNPAAKINNTTAMLPSRIGLS